MFGDDPSADIPEEEKSVSFTHKPVSQRIAIVLAGPLMNFFFAIFLFAGVGLYGDKEIGPYLGDIETDSTAWEQGFRSGDEITQINGQKIRYWDEVKKVISSNPDETLNFTLRRNDQQISLQATPKNLENPDVLEWEEMTGQIKGLSPLSRTSHIGLPSKDTPAHQAGLRSMDLITMVNGEKVKTWRGLQKTLADLPTGTPIELEGKRFSKDQKEPQAISATLQKTSSDDLMGIESSELYIFHLSEEMPAQKAGLKRGDKILQLNGQPVNNWDQVLKTVSSHKKGGGPIDFTVLRDNQPVSLGIVPKENSFMNEQGQEVTRFQVGIAPAIFQTVANPIIFKTSGLIESVAYGWKKTIHWTKTSIISFVRLIEAKVSPKNIGGIFTIGQVASETFKLGLSPYLRIMAIISVQLFILNLLPIPVLDGGHLMFFILEALKGAPVSLKKMEIAQQIGLILLMGLMAFALFNDITRLF